MVEGFFKSYFYYLACGGAALSVATAFPEFRPDWVAILAAAAYLRGGPLLASLLILSLAPAFAAFSRFSAWQLALPLLLTVLFVSSLQKRLAFGGSTLHALLLTVLVAADLGFRGLLHVPNFAAVRPDLGDGIWSLATVLLGTLVLPLLWEGIRRFGSLLGSWGRRPGQVGFFRAWMRRSSARDGDEVRRPFGLEKRF